MQSRASSTSSEGFNVWDRGSLGRRSAGSQTGRGKSWGRRARQQLRARKGQSSPYPVVRAARVSRTWGLRATGSGTPAGRGAVTRSGRSEPLDLAREFGDVVQRDLRGTRVVRRPTGALGPKRGDGGESGSRSPLTPDPRRFKERQRPAESADRRPPVGAR